MSTGETIIRVGHSPDSDDAFMFYALTHDRIDTEGLRFVHQLEDIQTLNGRALRGELEVSAISIHAFAYVAEKYALLASGASMGEGYGPKIVTRTPMTVEDLKGKTIAVPGKMTSAFLALQLALGKETPVVQMAFDAVLPAVQSGEVEAGVIIHEGQLYYQDKGLHQVLDLGVWWNEKTGGLPLPLGGNVVRKDLGAEMIDKIARLLKESIQYALDHRQEALEYALTYARDLDPALADEFVGMYVNQRTVDYGPEGRKAVKLFLDEGAEMGLVPGPLPIQFVG
ncbi:menaquinone biosynthesis family protein [Paludisphaera rhizosphaerae]|uniref:menaquinone biosynthesis family protein n=1 Tax=Paludisphaera rhizosphaerae TaxID=2711216 RepID=UPI0013EBD85F|nr:MqnA/MqnD/SBP family protein [Paludisphaera rhizosphaerae]